MANEIRTRWKVSGIADLRGFIADIKPSAQSRILAGAMAEASKPIVVSARGKVQKDSGALKRSLGFVVRRYPEKGQIASFIGARKGKYKQTKTRTGKASIRRSKKGEDGPFLNPANYSHLLEFGHRVAKGGPLRDTFETEMTVVNGKRRLRKTNRIKKKATGSVAGFVRPYPFLAPAVAQTRGQVDAAIGAGFDKALKAEYDRAQRKFSKSVNLIK